MLYLVDTPAAFLMNLFLDWISLVNYVNLDTAMTNITQRLMIQGITNSDGFDFDIYRNLSLNKREIISNYYAWVSCRNIKIRYLMLNFSHWPINNLYDDNFCSRYLQPLCTEQIRCIEIDNAFHFQNIISSKDAVKLINSCKQLVQLKIEWFSEVGLINGSILRQLVLLSCQTINIIDVNYLAKNCRVLEKLMLIAHPQLSHYLPDQNNCSERSYVNLFQNNPNLEMLSLRFDSYTDLHLCSSQFLIDLCQFCPYLTSLFIVVNENHGISLRAALRSIILLKKLEVYCLKMNSSQWGEITLFDYVLQQHEEKCIFISSFNIGSCDDLFRFFRDSGNYRHIGLGDLYNEKLIKMIAKNCPELRSLEVKPGIIRHLSEDATRYIRAKCPHLISTLM
jgi:hypothetical protein